MRIVVFGIHPDDVELGCGGSVIRAVDEGLEVTIVDLTDGSAASNGTVEERRAEATRAARVMGVAARVNLGLPDTGLQSEDLEQTRRIVACIREHKPQIVFVPSSDDPHPDHEAGGKLVRRALYLSGVHGYETGHAAWPVANALIYPGRIDFEPDLIVDITDAYERKVRAIEAHKSQFQTTGASKPTPLNSPDFLPAVEARSRTCGSKIGVRHGEGFRLLKPLALPGFKLLGG